MEQSARPILFVVDNESQVLKAIGNILKSRDYEVFSFTSADPCREALKKQNCDLLITDFNMPGMDGIELLKESKQIKPILPVIIISAYINHTLKDRAVKATAAAVIEKPLDQETFLPLVASLLKHP
jgi:two-component system cell cycle sensor histidine kinase/response regulator CckA